MGAEPRKAKSNAMANQFLALAMFIMLLAFFIVLNAISEFEEQKVTPVLSSIEKAFTGGSDILPPKVTASQGEQPSDNETNEDKESTKEGSTLDEIEGFFSAQIPGLDSEKVSDEGTFIVHAKEPVLKFAVDHIEDTMVNPYIVKKEGFDYFLGGVLYLMVNNEKYKNYHIDIFLNTRKEPASNGFSKSKEAEKQVKLAAQLAEKLERSGLDTRYINIGLQKGKRGHTSIVFREYKGYTPIGGSDE